MKLSEINKYLYFFFLFAGANGSLLLGLEDKRYHALLFVAFIVLAVLWFNEKFFKQTYLLFLLAVVVSEFLFKVFYLKSSGAYVYCISILGAPLGLLAFTGYFSSFSFSRRRNLFYITVAFYLVECLMAIAERIYGHTFIGFQAGEIQMDIIETGIYDFRSTALCGHPLSNALVVSLLMSYFLTSSLKVKYKMSLWAIGYIAILCFNTRSSIMGNMAILFVYLVFLFVNKRKKVKFSKVYFFYAALTLIGIIYVLLSTTGLGGRLTQGSLSDSSVETRFDIWYIFHVINNETFLIGTDDSTIMLYMYNAGLYAMENFWVILVLRFGIIFLLFYTISYAFLFKKLFKSYNLYDKLIILSTFIFLASTNNSLADGYYSLLNFMICSYIFNPVYFNKYVPQRYLEATVM